MLRHLLGSALVLSLVSIACSSGSDDATAPPATNDIVAAPGGGAGSDGGAATAPSGGDAGAAPADPPQPDLNPTFLVNIGDSISQGFDADDSAPIDITVLQKNQAAIYHDNPQFSWIQGTDERVGSVTAHYKAKNKDLKTHPLSHSGAEMVNPGSIPSFAQQAQMIIDQKLGTPDVVYVLLGGNDVCHRDPSTTDDAAATMYTVDKWISGVQKGLAILAQTVAPGGTVRFVSMPRVDLLYGALATATVHLAYDTAGGKLEAPAECRDLWTLTASIGAGICKIVTTETSDARRAQIGVRIDAYNDALADTVRAFAKDPTKNPKGIKFQSDWHGGIDHGGVKNASGGTFLYTDEDVGKLDCFHPSIKGQHAIADMVLNRAKFE